MIPPEKQKALAAHINSKWAGSACRLCNANTWSMEGYITLIVSDTIGLVLGSPMLPTVALVCMNCGNTVLVNAQVAGIAPPPTPPETPTGGTSG